MKGYTGFVVAYNHVTQKFLVGLDFSFAQILFERSQFTEIDRDAHMRSPPARAPTPLSDSHFDDQVMDASFAQAGESSHATPASE